MPTSIPESALRSKHATLAGLLRDQIVRGDLLPGDRLPSFAEFRTQHGAAISTVEKVLTALEREGLIERQHGRGTFVTERRRNLTGNIGFIGSAAFKAQQSPYYVHIAEGVQDAARQHRRRVMLLGTDRDWDAASFATVDGLLLCGHRDETNLEIMREAPAGMPCVSMLTVSEEMSCVVSDEYGGAQLAVQHLLQLGHRRIACLMGEKAVLQSGRFVGYRDALQTAGITVDPSWMRIPEVSGCPKPTYQQWAQEQMQIWLNDGWKETRCTALLVQNDQAAIGAMQLLQQEGIRVPGEVSIVGFDGTELCDYTSPRLASVQLPLEQIGSTAVDTLIRHIENGFCEPQTIVLPAAWRAGASVSPPG